MNNDPMTKKINYQLQQMAFQKYPFEINGKNFFCLESYFEDQLLNGVDLEIKQAKGMSSESQKISYIAQSQQIILTMGSNIITYNAQKRSYSLLTEVNGFVQILRTYTSKINNRTFVYWLQSDEEGLNIKTKKSSKNHINLNGNETQSDEKKQPKATSIWDIEPVAEILFGKKPDRIIENQSKHHHGNPGILENSRLKKLKSNQQPEEQRPKSKKKVRIEAPQQSEQGLGNQKNKKKMRICIFDYQKKCMIHKDPLEVEENQTINEIFLYFMTQKMVGYVINDELEQRAKIYYKKIKIDQSFGLGKSAGKRTMGKKKTKVNPRRPEKFNLMDSIFELPLLKYNGETDQYLFKNMNTVYSLQLYQVQHEMTIGKPSSKNIVSGGNYCNSKPANHGIISSHSIQLSDNESQMEEQVLSKEIQKITKNMIGSSITKISYQKEKHKLKICEEIELLTDENILDISISEVYLVVLTNEFIRFYSIFNLNTLLFKCEIYGLKEYPLPSSVQLNKSYLLLTHDNSTYVSSYSILQRKLKYNSTCEVQIQHCQSITKLFMNSYNCEVAVLARQFEIEGRMTNILKSKKTIQTSSSSYKKTYLDISLAYINFSSTKCETKALFLKNQRFRNILTCKWHSEYLIETQNQILAKEWRQGFKNLKCACLHPTGQYLLIGFNDCFRLYAVTQQGLQNTYMSDGVKDCQAIIYSEYGQHFAVGSSNTINIYNSYNCRKKLTINLPVGSLVQTLQYRNNHLICTLKTKRIIIYHALLQYKEIFTFNTKNYLSENKHELQRRPGESLQNLMALTIKGLMSIDVHSLFYDLDLQVVIFSSGKKIFFLNTLTNESLGSYDVEAISCMEYNKHLATLFLGTASGELIAFPWPNKPSNILSQLPRFKFHSEKIMKIKLTSDLKYLITLGNDMSIYKSRVSYILNLKRLKGNQIAQYKGNKNITAYCNFLQNKGICQFSHSQTIQKLETKKQLQQQVVNTVFMLPEQRMKQKEQLFEQISTTKQELANENLKEYEPLQEESISLRNNILKLKDEFIKVHRLSEITIDREKYTYNQHTSKLLTSFSEFHHGLRLVNSNLQDNIKQLKQNNHTQYLAMVKEHQIRQKSLLQQIQTQKQLNQSLKNNFLQLTLIDEQKYSFLKNELTDYQNQFQLLTTKNGQLTCKNSTIEKQILVSKYRIEELKFVIINANYSIHKLKHKKNKETQQKIIFENLLVENAKIDVSEMEKKYIKATKELIEKNKLIDINLSRYEKEKEILVTLQKTVENTESEIDHIVDSLQQQKSFMNQINHRKQAYIARFKELTQQRKKIKFDKSKGQLELRKFLHQIQNLEKEFQSSMNNNKKQLRTETHTVIEKLKNLEVVEKRKANHLTERTISATKEESLTNRNKASKDTLKTNTKNDTALLSKDTTVSPLTQVMTEMKRTGFSFNKSKKDKKLIRSSTEESIPTNNNEVHKTQQFADTSKTTKDKSKHNLKINHNKFKEEFAKYRKDDLIYNNKIPIRQQSERITIEQSALKLLKKPTKRYYQIRTQNSYQTERLANTIAEMTQTTTKPFKPIQTHVQSLGYSYQQQKQITKQTEAVYKKLTSEQKLMNKIKNEKKLFMTQKKIIQMQNQDLINTYNSLTYDNKYFKNIVQAYEQNLDEQDKNCIFNNPFHAKQFSKKFITIATEHACGQKTSRDLMNQTVGGKSVDVRTEEQEKLRTPFEKYLNNKENKIKQLKNKVNQTEFYQPTEHTGFKPSLNKLTKPKTSQLKRIKTVPCMEIKVNK